MAGTSTLQMINSIPKIDGTDYVEWSRSFNDILQISCPFLSKTVSGLETPKPIPKSREEDAIEGSDDETGYIDECEPSNNSRSCQLRIDCLQRMSKVRNWQPERAYTFPGTTPHPIY